MLFLYIRKIIFTHPVPLYPSFISELQIALIIPFVDYEQLHRKFSDLPIFIFSYLWFIGGQTLTWRHQFLRFAHLLPYSYLISRFLLLWKNRKILYPRISMHAEFKRESFYPHRKCKSQTEYEWTNTQFINWFYW